MPTGCVLRGTVRQCSDCPDRRAIHPFLSFEEALGLDYPSALPGGPPRRARCPMKKKQTIRTTARQSSSKKTTSGVPTDERHEQSKLDAPVPIVGMGASAGGLEALKLFFEQAPVDSGLGFVIVQHLDPTHKGMMAELLQHTTTMKVQQVVDRMTVEANHVYVIPPNKDMSILHGVLHLMEPSGPRGMRLPIDFFFRSLAEDLGDRSIGVILSGMGTDGSLGLRSIKEKAGVVLVQDPASAKFDGMPRSAIDAGLADIVAPAGELPGRILTHLRHVPLLPAHDEVLSDNAQSALDKVVILLRAQTGHDFSLYKKSTVYRRIERRMSVHQIDSIADYVRYLRENPQELEILFKELLIGVTRFFRDASVWEQVGEVAIPSLLANRSAERSLRAWVPGCSTGEEAYSLAMVFKEALARVSPPRRFSLQVFATDLDRDAIDKARQGLFPDNITADVSPERLGRFFVKEESGYRIAKDIREMVIFAVQSIVADPPFTKLDILTCRNLLIYLSPELQKKILPLFHYSLNPGGVLLLGNAETIVGFTDLFAPIDAASRLYRRTGSPLRAESVDFPSSFAPARLGTTSEMKPPPPPVNLQSLADKLLLEHFSPAAALVNANGDILYLSAKAGKYLKLPAGKANWNIHAMTGDSLRHEMATCFQRALRQKHAVTRTNIKVGSSGATQDVDLTVQVIDEPEPLRGMVMVVFVDVAPSVVPSPVRRGKAGKVPDDRSARLELELNQAREELRFACEQMQTSQEELTSANEELQSTNEELQSTNEELTTSKEEMQSLNEELQTLNAELQSKVEELSRANNDMKNLLNSTDVASIFLDSELRVRRFTTQATRIIRLLPGDVGRPVTDIASALLYPDLADDIQEVLRTLVALEKQIVTREVRWYVVRIMPYRTLANRIDGVVITFTDCTASKNLEAKLRRAQTESEARREELTEQLLKSNEALRNAIGEGNHGQPDGDQEPEETEETEETEADLS